MLSSKGDILDTVTQARDRSLFVIFTRATTPNSNVLVTLTLAALESIFVSCETEQHKHRPAHTTSCQRYDDYYYIEVLSASIFGAPAQTCRLTWSSGGLDERRRVVTWWLATNTGR